MGVGDNESIELYHLRNTRVSKVQTQLMLTKNLNFDKYKAPGATEESSAIVTRSSTVVEQREKYFENAMRKLKSDLHETEIKCEE